MKEKSRHLIPVHIVADRFEGDLMMDALRKEGVPALMQTFEETAYDGLFVPQRGWGRILAPAEDLSKAREIIQPLLEDKSPPGIYEDPAEIDPLLWDTLEQADPEAVCRSAGVPFDRSLSAYRIPFLNNEYHCDPGQRIIRLAEGFPAGCSTGGCFRQVGKRKGPSGRISLFSRPPPLSRRPPFETVRLRARRFQGGRPKASRKPRASGGPCLPPVALPQRPSPFRSLAGRRGVRAGFARPFR